MPVYDYDCAACGRRFEVIHGVHVDGPTTCPLCGKGPVRKAISAPAIHYKGSGWAKKERRATVSPGSSTSGSDGASGDDAGSKTGDATETPAATSSSSSSTASSTPASTSTKAPGAGTTSAKD
jgi:putative FmdB family regulatory protein